MPALLPISQIACSWSTEELQASAQAPVVEMFCDADLSPLHDDQAPDDSCSDVDQVSYSVCLKYFHLTTSLQLEACLEEEIEGQDGDDGEGGSNVGSRCTLQPVSKNIPYY